MAYKSLVRPLLEYASTVWDPATQKNINKVEAVQRRAARFVLHRHRNTSNVGDMLATLNWQSLEHRRKTARLAMLYKIQHGLAHVNCADLEPQPQRSRRSHSKTYKRFTCRADYRQNAFFPKTVRDWNALPQEAVDAPSLDTFIQRVARLC